LTFPADMIFRLHIAGEMNGTEQRCSRCGKLIFKAGSGADSLWRDGQLVAVSDSGSVRMVPREGVEYENCDGRERNGDAGNDDQDLQVAAPEA